HIRGNRELLAQAVSNLLDNAIKYTPPGGTVTVQVRTGDDGGAELAVSDTGPGIPPEAREQVTERFVRLDPARSTSGNGLGLSLVKAVAGLHGGRLVLEDSGPGLRARVCFGGA
ncbi:MAG TPA: sensor histidine kinase, partial [Gammaproteobacteria bacterium]|nr:sensor histidine kinase [Gammaproteobacteria bacterium]